LKETANSKDRDRRKAERAMSVPREYFLTTKRLGFRHWTEADEALAFGLWGDPQVTKTLGGPFTDEQVRQRLAKHITMAQEHGIQYWPIFLLATAKHVGCCGIQPYKTGIPELGYHLRQKFWGKGLAKEAAGAVIDYAFANLKIDAIFAGHLPENMSSRKVLLSLGFQYAGEEVYPPTGILEPTYRLDRPKRSAVLTGVG
jgi:RimJ/RimL family protein N-acetyltransferase